jgi:hypothetical protein
MLLPLLRQVIAGHGRRIFSGCDWPLPLTLAHRSEQPSRLVDRAIACNADESTVGRLIDPRLLKLERVFIFLDRAIELIEQDFPERRFPLVRSYRSFTYNASMSRFSGVTR